MRKYFSHLIDFLVKVFTHTLFVRFENSRFADIIKIENRMVCLVLIRGGVHPISGIDRLEKLSYSLNPLVLKPI